MDVNFLGNLERGETRSFEGYLEGKEIVLWMNGSLIDKKNDPYKGKEIGYACGWKLKGAWHQEWHESVF